MIFPGKHSWVVLPVAPGQASGTHAGSVNQLIGFISLFYKNLNSCFFSNHDLCTGGSYILRKQLHFLFLPLLIKVRTAHPSRLHAQRSEGLTGTLLGSSAAPDLREHTNKDSLSSFLKKIFFVPPSSSPFKFCRSGLVLGARRPRRRPATTRLCGSRCPSAL